MNAEMDISKNQWRSTGGKAGFKISNLNMLTAKHLAQASCTDLTLHILNFGIILTH